MDAGRPAKRKGGAAASGDGAARQLAQQFHRQLAVAVSKDPAALQLAQVRSSRLQRRCIIAGWPRCPAAYPYTAL